jgi:hypothetical protein
MVLRKTTTRSFYRFLYAGEDETVTLLKRNDDLAEGIVRSLTVFHARRRPVYKTGQPIQGELSSNERAEWMIPAAELARVGVNYINVLDRIVDKQNRFWQPESGDTIRNRLWENYCSIACQRVDPPSPPAKAARTTIS